MVTKSWKLGVDKNGVLIVTYLDGRGIMKTATPASGSVSVRGSGIEFEDWHKVLELFTEEGYRTCLESLNVADLAAEFEKYRRV